MRKFTTGFLMLMALTVLTSCLIAGPAEPYVYAPTPCGGCWHGTWSVS